jgi:hypothetical protein
MTGLLKFGFISRRAIVTPMKVSGIRTNYRQCFPLLVFIIRLDVDELKFNLTTGTGLCTP